MDKFIGFFRTVSFLLFTAALLWSYAYMVGQVTYRFDTEGNPIFAIDKEVYFYSAIAIFLFTNVVCVTFIQYLKKIKTSETGKGLRNRSLKLDLITWFKGFAGVLNLFFSLVLFYLGLTNIAESQQSITMGFYIYLGPILIIAWLVYLAVLLTKRRI